MRRSAPFTSAHAKKLLSAHVLEKVPGSDVLHGFYLRKPEPGIRMESTLILFTPEGIVIMGDVCPSRHGVISAFGYGLGWFADRLSEQYLCEKFLRRTWQREAAINDCHYYVQQARGDGEIQTALKWRRIRMDLEGEAIVSIDGLHDAMTESEFDTADRMPGETYDERDAAWLCAIQQRFAELFKS